jgi:hypothetical protein
MSLTDESSLLREKLRELQTENDFMQQIIITFNELGDCKLVRDMVETYNRSYNIKNKKTLDE